MPDNDKNISIQKNISVRDVLLENIKHWYIVLSIIIISLLLTVIYTLCFVTPMYRSTAKLYITNKESSEISTSDINVSYYLSQDFIEIMTDTPVLKKVAEELGNKYSVNTLKRYITVRKPENTRIIEITAYAPNAKDSKLIVDSVCKVSEIDLVETMGLDRVKTIREGDLPSSQFSPNLTNNMLTAFITALVISEIIIILNFIFNSKISTTKDIEKYLGLNTLAAIPYNMSKAKRKK